MNSQNNSESSLSGVVHTSQAHSLTTDHGSADDSQVGGVYYEAYAYSKAGHNKTTNTDNFYCGHTYMKGFKYMDFKKSAYVLDKNTVFAVCTGEGNDDWADDSCKAVFDFISKNEERLVSGTNLNETEAILNEVMSVCDANLVARGMQVHMIISVLIPGYVVYAAMGDVMLVHKHKNRVVDITHNVGVPLGTGRIANIACARHMSYERGDMFVLCSRGIKRLISIESLAEELKKPFVNMKEAAIRVIEKTVKCGILESSTCVAVETKGREYVGKLAYIISAACGVLTLLDILIIIRSLML